MWCKLPKQKSTKPHMDPIDEEAERQANAIERGAQPVGATGKKTAKIHRKESRGAAINENRATRHIQVREST